jgi:hypothetical protein
MMSEHVKKRYALSSESEKGQPLSAQSKPKVYESIRLCLYRLYLPSENELRAELQRGRELIERQIEATRAGEA